MKTTQSVTMLVTLMALSSGLNNALAKNIQSGKTYSCSSVADCKKKCEDDGNTWKPDPRGKIFGTCTEKKKNSNINNRFGSLMTTGSMVAQPTRAPLQAIPTISNVETQSQVIEKKPPLIKPVVKKGDSATKSKTPGFTKPNLPVILKPTVSKPTTGIKTAPPIKNINRTPVRLPTNNVKTLKPGLVSPARPVTPNPYSNVPQKSNVQQAETNKRTSAFVPIGKPIAGGSSFVPDRNVTGTLVTPELQNPNLNTGNRNDNVKPDFVNGVKVGGRVAAQADDHDGTTEAITLSVTGDSVVATAVIVIDDNQSTLTLDWGDGDVEQVNLGAHIQVTSYSNNQDHNTFRFQHEYKKPFDSRYIISSWVTNPLGGKAWDHALFDINPRYNFTLYSIILGIPSGLDFFTEDHAEIEARVTATQGNQSVFEHTREENVSNDKSSSLRMNGFTREISRSDEPVEIKVSITEADGIGEEGSLWNDIWDVVSAPFRGIQWLAGFRGVKFDGSSCALSGCEEGLSVHPQNNFVLTSSTKTDSYDIGTREGTIEVKYSYELKLIVPLDAAPREVKIMR
jgi:hypothetical protein